MTDITWPVTNKGNTTAAYAFRATLKRALPLNAKLQLIVRRVYIAPQANFENTCGPLLPTLQSQVLVNIPSPNLGTGLTEDFDPNEYADNASFFLAPSDRGFVTLRVFCPEGETCSTNGLAAARVVSQAPNNCPPGETSAACAGSGSNPDDIYNPADAIAPVLSVPASFAIEATGPDGAVVNFSATAIDDLSGALVATCAPASGSTFPIGPTNVACSATDAGGNVGTATFTVTVADTTAPAVTVPANITTEATGASGAVVTFTATATDVVGGAVTAVCTPASGSVFPLGTTPVTCSATDAGGKNGSASFTVTVVDTTAPIVSVPADITAEATSAGGAAVTFAATATDAVGGPVPASCVPASGSTFPFGTTRVTCAATDGAQVTASASFSVTVVDTTPPAVTGPANLTVEAAGATGTPVTFTATASDIVNGLLPATCAPASGSTFALGTTTVTCSATDAGGRIGTASFTVTVEDTVIPTVGGFSFPAGFNPDQWYDAPSITATINVTDGSSVSVLCTDSLGGTEVNGLTITISGNGTHAVSCTVTDGGGNTAEASTTVKLDSEDPVVSVPAVVITAEAASAAGAMVNYTFSASDAFSGATVACAPSADSIFAIGDTRVACTATDGAGNEATASFTVTVRDTTAPAIALNGATTMSIAMGSTFLDPGATASDAVDGAVGISASGAVDTTVPGVYTITYTATDTAKNTATASLTVTVVDKTPPVLTLPATITAEATGSAGAIVTFVASATDTISGSLAASCSPASGSTFPLGPSTVSCSATDAAGNTASGSFSVTVKDTTKPAVTLNGQADATIEAKTAFVDPGATATDGVSGTLPVTISGTVNTNAVGVYTLTYTATDASANSGSASRTVRVVDTTRPVVTLNGVSAVTIEAGAVFTDPGATAVDTLAGVLPVTVTGTVQTTVVGTYTLTYSATDPSGNTGTATRTVTVRDTAPPVVTESVSPMSIWSPNGAMVPVTVSGTVTDAGSGVASVTFAVADEYRQIQPSGTITLNADGTYSFTVSLQASRKGSDKNGRTYTVTIVATDKAGLKTTVSQTLVAVEHNQGG